VTRPWKPLSRRRFYLRWWGFKLGPLAVTWGDLDPAVTGWRRYWPPVVNWIRDP